VILDSAAAVARATAQLGKPDGAGQCLANVYRWFGSVQSIGPGSGHYDVAIAGWDYAPDKHPGDYSPPAGVPVYYDRVTAPRWPGDHNMAAGDVGLSAGPTAFSRESMAFHTDSPTGNTGLMTIRARAAQIGRRYLGWTPSFLGHETTAGNAYGKPTPPAVTVTVGTTPVKIDPNGDRMYAIRNNAKGSPGYGAIFALAPGYIKHEADRDEAYRLQTIAGDAKDLGDLNTVRDVVQAFGLPPEAADPNWIAQHANAGVRAYSAIVAGIKG
jgi:hypothetical protein